MERIAARSWLVWGVAVAAYTVGVLQRTSLGVSGLAAADRFHVFAAALGTFPVTHETANRKPSQRVSVAL